MSKAKVIQDQSKIFVDKSGSETVKDPILKRIRDIHIKEPVTPQTFLQPIAPNLERTPSIQKKQIPFDAEKARLELEQHFTETVRDIIRFSKDSKVKESEISQFQEILNDLPDLSTLNLFKAASKGDLIGLIRALKQKGREQKLVANEKTRKEVSDTELDYKKIIDEIKKKKEEVSKQKTFKTDEKGKQTEVK